MTIIGLPEAERRLRDVRSVALGGMLLENRPSTLVRALLRSGAAGLFLCSAPAASWDADVLLGAGRVATVRIPHISLASLGLAPATRRAAAAGTVVFEDCDEATPARRLPRRQRQRPDPGAAQPRDQRPRRRQPAAHPVRRPRRRGSAAGGRRAAARSARRREGNLVHFGSRWADLLIARSARHVIAQVDHVVPTDVAARLGVSIPGYLVDEVVEAPFGAHPLGSVGGYVADLDHLAAYQATVNAGGFAGYLDRYCAIDHPAYLEQLGPRGCASWNGRLTAAGTAERATRSDQSLWLSRRIGAHRPVPRNGRSPAGEARRALLAPGGEGLARIGAARQPERVLLLHGVALLDRQRLALVQRRLAQPQRERAVRGDLPRPASSPRGPAQRCRGPSPGSRTAVPPRSSAAAR